MEPVKELVAMLARIDQIASAEEHAGHCDAAELLVNLAEHLEQILGALEPIRAAA